MPSFQDSAVIFFIALLLFGPKKLPELARYVGKLMNEFRRASSEFRMQMDDEFRQIEQAEARKKIEAMQAAAPATPAIESLASESPTESLDQPIVAHVEYDPDNPYIPPTAPEHIAAEAERQNVSDASTTYEPGAPSQTAPSFEVGSAEAGSAPLPIASNGDLHLMPPETGLPVSRSNSIGGFSDPAPTPPDRTATPHENETTTHG